jgi:HK97 family phage prohead protease
MDRPYGVVKVDGELEGCHATEVGAEAQQAALYASETDEASRAANDTHTPPAAVQAEAAKAVRWIEDGLAGDGFTAVGRRRAQQLADGDPVSTDTLTRMRSYFARHQPDTEVKGFNSGEPGYPTPGRVAWSAWGGNPGRAWADEVMAEVDDMNDEETSSMESRSIDDTTYPVTPRQRAHYEATESVAELFGKWGPGVDADGAHYVPVSPFADEGLVCASCVFYEGGRSCEVVEVGPEGVAPEGVCKLWIIPADLVGETVTEEVPVQMASRNRVRPSVEQRSGGFPTDNLLRALAVPEAAQFRASTSTDGNTLYGHFAVFDTFTEIDSVYEGRFLERIAPGAFSSTFADRGDKIRVLYDHGKDPSIGNKPLGVPVAFGEDDRGAFYEVELFDTDYVNELRPALEAGQLGASFRFSITDEKWHNPASPTDHNPEMLPERTIHSAQLWEFGPVTFPAYDAASAGLRSRTDEFVEMLADPGFAVRLADRVGSHVVENLLRSLPGDPRSGEPKTGTPTDGRGPVAPSTDPKSATLTAQALTDLSRRKTR